MDKKECLKALVMLSTQDTCAESVLAKYQYFKREYDMLFKLIDNYFELEKSLDKSCKELVKMCKQTNCKDCHFVKEQIDCNNDCPVRGNYTYHDWKEWCLKDE